MSKKLLFLTVLIISTLFTLNSVSAACSIWRYRFDVKTVKVNSSLSGEDIPVVAIGWSRDHTSDLTFYAQLSGAEWNYGKSGTIMRGVTYSRIGKDTLEITVDVGTGSDELNFGGGYNLYLPIDCTITEAGEVRLIIDSNETTVSNANLLIAKAVDGRITVHGNKAQLKSTGSLKKVTLTDSSSQAYKAGQKFTMELDTGFHFTGDVNITGTGKFANIVKFEPDKKNSTKAYITITEDTPSMNGEIVLENMMVTRKSNAKFTVAMLKTTFNDSVIPLKSTLAVATYDEDAEDSTSSSTTEATTETTTAAQTSTKPETSEIKIQIGAGSYTIDNRVYPLDVPAYISNGSTMLPLRALANAIGITDENIQYSTETKTAVLSPKQLVSVSITAGEAKIDISQNGMTAHQAIATPAEITDGRLFLPLRAMANALGIDDSAIKYNAITKTVTIQK